MTPLLWPEGILWSKNIIKLLLQSAYGADGYFDLTIYFGFGMGSTPGVEPIAVQRLHADDGGYIELNLQRVVNDAFQNRAHLGGIPRNYIYGEVLVSISEKYAGAEVDTADYAFTAWQGGVPWLSQFREGPGDQTGYFPAFKLWLTWKPDKTKVSKAQPEIIYYLQSDASILPTVRFILYDNNGASYTKDVDYTPDGIQWDILAFAVGYNDNALNDLLPGAGEFPAYYTVQVLDRNAAYDDMTVLRTYYVDLNYEPYERFIRFTNSLGCLEVVRLIGEASSQATYEDVDVSTFVSQRTNLHPLPSTGERLSSEETMGISRMSGWKSRAEIEWLRDMRLSRNVQILEKSSLASYWVPITLTKKEVPQPKDNQDLYFIALEYEYTERNKTYAPFGSALPT